MSELFLMTTITDRTMARTFLSFYEKYQIQVTFSMVGHGTAASEVLDYFGLESSEKVIIVSVVTKGIWKQVKAGLQTEMKIDVPGTGIAFIVPFSSIGGKKQLQFLTDNQNFEKGEESTLKDTKYELLVVVANQGYTEYIMEAARSANAAGGTVIHAKGTGMQKAEQFLGFSLATEKEMILIVVKNCDKNAIMKAIMEKAGLESKAKSIVFSLPVTETAGMRLVEDE